MKYTSTSLALVCAALSFTAVTAEAKLKAGDPAPALKTGEWIQGEPVKEFSKDNIYVVEFWATWCGPCVATIPHLDELHEAMKDQGVIFIGQNCREDDTQGVKDFVKKMGEKMSYRVAMDDTAAEKDGFMTVNWLNAAEQPGIPCAFVVGKDGRIAWIGHPQLLNADMLKEVAAGTFDAARAADEQDKRMAGLQKLMADGPKIEAAVSAGEWEKALTLIDSIEKDLPEMSGEMAALRMEVALQKGDTALLSGNATKFLDSKLAEDPEVLNKVAWGIATRVGNPSREALQLAETASARAVEKTKSEDALFLSTHARVLFMLDKKPEAIAIQEKAVSIAKEGQKDGMAKLLSAYKEGKLPPAGD